MLYVVSRGFTDHSFKLIHFLSSGYFKRGKWSKLTAKKSSCTIEIISSLWHPWMHKSLIELLRKIHFCENYETSETIHQDYYPCHSLDIKIVTFALTLLFSTKVKLPTPKQSGIPRISKKHLLHINWNIHAKFKDKNHLRTPSTTLKLSFYKLIKFDLEPLYLEQFNTTVDSQRMSLSNSK